MKTHSQSIALAIALCGALTASATSQTTEQGYANKVTDLPDGSGQTLDLGFAKVYFTGTELVLQRGSTKRSLLKFQKAVFGSFTIRAGSDSLLFGESSNGGIWRVPLSSTGTPKLLGTIKFNYSATMYNRRWAIISAKTGGFTAKNNDVIAIDLSSGTLDPIAVVPGASGPITVGKNGDLYYVTASLSFPPPKGYSDAVKFPAAKIRSAFGSTTLGITDAVVLYKGIDAAGALARDGDDDLFLTDWVNGEIVEISDVNGKSPRASTLASYAGASVSPSGLQFMRGFSGRDNREFEPFQTSGAGQLVIHESKFGSTSRLRSLSPRRASIGGSKGNRIPKASAFDLVVKNGATQVTGFVLIGIGSHTREAVLARPFEAPILWSKSLLKPVIVAPVTFDSSGEAKLSLFNPGFSKPLVLTTQAYFQTSVSAGSSKPANIVLR